MAEFLTSLPNTVLGWIGIFTLVVVGGIAIWGLVDRQLRDRRKDAIDGADDVITILKEKVEVLENKVREMEAEHETHTKQIAELKATNETLTKILQGRDETTVTFQHKMLEAVRKGEETNGVVKKMEESVTKMADAMTALTEAINKKGV